MYDVVVIGAGSTGLTLAAGLGRRGVRCLVVDRDDRPATGARCAVLQPGALDALARLGVRLDSARPSVPLRGRVFHVGPHSQARPLPRAALVLSQERTDQLLEAAAVNGGVAVERGTEAIGVRQGAGGVELQVRGPRGDRVIRTSWLVMCTGADRAAPGLAGLGWSAERRRELRQLGADVLVRGLPGLGAGEEHIFHGPYANLGFLPLPDGAFRVFSITAARPPRDARELQEFVRRVTGTQAGVTLRGDLWLTEPASGRGRVRNGHCLLLGEAARRLPLPVQSLNTALEEAAGLAAELAAVIRGHAGAEDLDAYAAEWAPAIDRMINEGWATLDRGTTPDPERWLVTKRKDTA